MVKEYQHWIFTGLLPVFCLSAVSAGTSEWCSETADAAAHMLVPPHGTPRSGLRSNPCTFSSHTFSLADIFPKHHVQTSAVAGKHCVVMVTGSHLGDSPSTTPAVLTPRCDTPIPEWPIRLTSASKRGVYSARVIIHAAVLTRGLRNVWRNTSMYTDSHTTGRILFLLLQLHLSTLLLQWISVY